MTPRHSVAFALVGWYLMIPPLTPAGQADPAAPITEWKVADTFDRQDMCLRAAAAYALGYGPAAGAKAVAFARCIATDDPRLKGKSDTRPFNLGHSAPI